MKGQRGPSVSISELDRVHDELLVVLVQSGDRVRPTELGRRFTNDVVGLFLDD